MSSPRPRSSTKGDAWPACVDPVQPGAPVVAGPPAGVGPNPADLNALVHNNVTGGDISSLPEMAQRINPFLVESGLAKKEADLTGLFDPTFTKTYAEKSS